MIADYVSMNLRRAVCWSGSPAIPTAEMPINAARSTGIIGNFLLGGCFYGEKDKALEYFNISDLDDIYNAVENNQDYFVKKYNNLLNRRV